MAADKQKKKNLKTCVYKKNNKLIKKKNESAWRHDTSEGRENREVRAQTEVKVES